MEIWGWCVHDGKRFGRQVIVDEENNLKMVTEFQIQDESTII